MRGVPGKFNVRKGRGTVVDENAAAFELRDVFGDFDVRKGRGAKRDGDGGAALRGVPGKFDVRKVRRAVEDLDAAAVVRGAAGNRQAVERDRGLGGSGSLNVEDAALAVGVDRDLRRAGFVDETVDRQRFADLQFGSGEGDRFALEAFGEGNRRARFGVLNRFAERDFAVERVDGVFRARNDRRNGFGRNRNRVGRFAEAVFVLGGDAVRVGRAVGERSGRPSRFFDFGDLRPFAVDELFDDVRRREVLGVPSQRRGQVRGDADAGQAGRRGRNLAFVGAEVDSSVEARVPGQVGRNRFGNVSVVTLVDGDGTVGESVIAVFRVVEENVAFVQNVIDDAFFVRVRPSVKGRQRVVSVRRRAEGSDFAGDNRVVERRRRDLQLNRRRANRLNGGFGDRRVRKGRRSAVDNGQSAALVRDVAGNFNVRKGRRSAVDDENAAALVRGVAGNFDVRKGRGNAGAAHGNAAPAEVRDVFGNFDVSKERRSAVVEENAGALVRGITGNFDVRKGRRSVAVHENAAALEVRITAGNRQADERDRSVGRSGDDVEDAALFVRVDGDAGFAAVNRNRFVDGKFRSAERNRRDVGGEGNRRAFFGVLNRFAERDFAVEPVDDVVRRRNDRRLGFGRNRNRVGRFALAVSVRGDNAVLGGFAVAEVIRRRRLVGGFNFEPFEAGEILDAVRRRAFDDVPSQRRVSARRVGDFVGKTGRRGRDVSDRKFFFRINFGTTVGVVGVNSADVGLT